MKKRIQQWVANTLAAAMFAGIVFLLVSKFLERL